MTEGFENGGGLSARVCVRNELGLHARPASILAKTAQQFDSEIILAMEEKQVDCKSILDILTLAAPQGCGLTLHASGEDASQALERLKQLFNNRFEVEGAE